MIGHFWGYCCNTNSLLPDRQCSMIADFLICPGRYYFVCMAAVLSIKYKMFCRLWKFEDILHSTWTANSLVMSYVCLGWRWCVSCSLLLAQYSRPPDWHMISSACYTMNYFVLTKTHQVRFSLDDMMWILFYFYFIFLWMTSRKNPFFFRIAELKRHAIIRLIQFFVNWWKKAEAVVCLMGCVHARERGLLRVAAYCMLVKISVSCEKGDVNSVVTTCLLDSLLNDTLQEFSFPFFFSE